MAIRAAEAHCAGCVHRRLIGLRVAGDASVALAVGLLLRLAHQVWAGFLIGGTEIGRGNTRCEHGEYQASGERGTLAASREPAWHGSICSVAIHLPSAVTLYLKGSLCGIVGGQLAATFVTAAKGAQRALRKGQGKESLCH
jgi:hypothetical protein